MFTKPKIKVSVCIPVCATEDFLEVCLESVALQELHSADKRKKDWLEIIVVDDNGFSSMTASQIVKRFLKRHKKEKIAVSFIQHEKNKGLVEARRTAVYEACGDYIMFLDSDDTLPPGAICALYEKAAESGADIVHGLANICVKGISPDFCKMTCVCNDDVENEFLNKRILDIKSKANRVYSGTLENRAVLDEYLLEEKISGFLWGKIFSRDLCLEAFNEIPLCYCIFGEDFLTYFYLSYFSKKYVGIKNAVYNYFVDTGISSNKKIYDLNEWKKVCSASSVAAILLNWIEEGRCGDSFPLEGVAQKPELALERGEGFPRLNEKEIDAVKKNCTSYAANNLAQLKKAVAPELQKKAYEMLCDWWGEEMIKNVERGSEKASE